MNYSNQNLSELLFPPTRVKRRCFVSYHHADEDEVHQFVKTFSGGEDAFTHRALGVDFEPGIIDSADTEYVMRRIREQYLFGTSVTIVMIGRGTWGRRYVDWEIAASLRSAEGAPPNGLMGIHLPTYTRAMAPYPERLNANLRAEGSGAGPCYADWHEYPRDVSELRSTIEQAVWRRDNYRHLINNAAPRFIWNKN
jgi:hypothetical protein